MVHTFANLPEEIERAIAQILQKNESDWVKRAVTLHENYTKRLQKKTYINDFTDVLAYLALRAPATYAQAFGALAQIQELLPTWKPKTMLDIGSGPGNGIWAAQTIWPDLHSGLALEKERYFLTVGKQIAQLGKLSVHIDWKQYELTKGLQGEPFDLIVISSVLNELNPIEAKKLVGQAYNLCSGVLVVVEPGTSYGVELVSSIAKSLSQTGGLLAPYLGNNFVETGNFWLHFNQRFIRPEFERRVRFHMRVKDFAASDWESAKYAYVALSKIKPELSPWGRVVGPLEKRKAFLEIPVLTEGNLTNVKIMKRDKKNYALAKKLKWGELVVKAIND